MVLGLLALLWQRRRPGWARLLLSVGLAELLVFSIEPVSRGLYARLESGARDSFQPDAAYDVVVVLGGVTDPVAMHQTGKLELNDAADRISETAILLRTGKARMALVSGGVVSPQPGDPPGSPPRESEAAWLAAWLRDQGIAPDRLVLEERSRNTHENAVESAAIIGGRGWSRVLLLTSAWHAPRALGCFRAAGLSPDLLTVDHRSGSASGILWLPRASALSASTDALREMFGGVVYRVMGYAR
jgi:uncharacterized SAM-binding protein YcdF (DUF218 family)